jgi:hypothetical protein
MFSQLNYKAIEDHLKTNIEHISKWEDDLHKYALFQVAASVANSSGFSRKIPDFRTFSGFFPCSGFFPDFR